MADVKILYCPPCRYDPQAESLAAKLRSELGIEVEVLPGSFGQFDVLVDDEVVATKSGGLLLSRLLGRGDFPDEDETVAAVRAKLGERVPADA